MTRKVFPFAYKRYFIEQVLDQAEGAQSAADKSSEQRAGQHQETDDIERKTVIAASENCLKGTDGTGPKGSRTGVAVQARQAQGLRRARIDFSFYKSQQIAISDRSEQDLYP